MPPGQPAQTGLTQGDLKKPCLTLLVFFVLERRPHTPTYPSHSSFKNWCARAKIRAPSGAGGDESAREAEGGRAALVIAARARANLLSHGRGSQPGSTWVAGSGARGETRGRAPSWKRPCKRASEVSRRKRSLRSQNHGHHRDRSERRRRRDARGDRRPAGRRGAARQEGRGRALGRGGDEGCEARARARNDLRARDARETFELSSGAPRAEKPEEEPQPAAEETVEIKDDAKPEEPTEGQINDAARAEGDSEPAVVAAGDDAKPAEAAPEAANEDGKKTDVAEPAVVDADDAKPAEAAPEAAAPEDGKKTEAADPPADEPEAKKAKTA